MGSGRARTTYLRSGANSFANNEEILGSGGIDGVYSAEDADKLTKEVENIYYDDGEDLDMSLVENLTKQGVVVDIAGITSGEVPKAVNNLVEESGVSLEKITQVLGGKPAYEIDQMVSDYVRGGAKDLPASTAKVLDVCANFGMRSMSAVSDYFSKVGGDPSLSDLYGSKNKADINQNINASLRIASRLASVSGDDFPGISLMGNIPAHFKNSASPMGSYNSGTKKIELSTQQLARNENPYRNRSWSVTANLNLQAASVIHEFGHYLDFSHKDISRRIKAKGTSVSNYGDSNSAEAFAESFTAYCLGVTPKRGTEYHKEFCRVMEAEGLSRFKGCISK